MRDIQRWVCVPEPRPHWRCIEPSPMEGRTAERIPAAWYRAGTVARVDLMGQESFRVRDGRFVGWNGHREAFEAPSSDAFIGAFLEIVPWASECVS
jgi:hypothetical protein